MVHVSVLYSSIIFHVSVVANLQIIHHLLKCDLWDFFILVYLHCYLLRILVNVLENIPTLELVRKRFKAGYHYDVLTESWIFFQVLQEISIIAVDARLIHAVDVEVSQLPLASAITYGFVCK